ncbi:gliding motility-associated protein GldE [Algoriphagus zhangzhouensis]|uniref:Gliding motility-associated protein GldE n=1 Tax=Algoriphagus zhangzhouensis TaxID=1073327 RepID=A0A1M7ZA60_9BACT|nr:gliding motility-associated protein GldE [Algoriphagus zhangzhouensis]TDY47251.1 gliding motility-associated protein GldE [Algoriphagus zhangzhouensis]SHO61764.1 gliding motility-associated protein GldE [Algoriphagus zhangzhouensis]
MDDPYPSWSLLAQITQPSIGYLIINGLFFLLLLLSSALVSGSEVAFFSLSNEDLDEIAEGETQSGSLVIKLLHSPKQLLSTILILNNLINIAIVTLTTFVSWSIFGMNATGIVVILVQTIGVTFAIVFLGEIVPKVYANKAKVGFSLIMAPTINFFSTILKPISLLLMFTSNLIERRIEKKGVSLSVDELNQALELTTEDAADEEKDILKGIVNFGTLTVKQVMKSRMEITAIDTEMDFHELMDKINKSGYSRIPVFEETIDNIEGVLYIKDLLPFIDRDENFNWKELIRKSFFVPENKKVDTLLKDFQQKRVHMAIVVDEYGGTSGLVTLEDLIEEIIGEINDEFDDTDDIFFQEIDSNTFIFEGKVSLNDFCKKLELDSQVFDDVKGESESLGGLLLEINSKLPKNGTKIQFDEFEFTILAVDARKIKKVKVHIHSGQKDDSQLFTD